MKGGDSKMLHFALFIFHHYEDMFCADLDVHIFSWEFFFLTQGNNVCEAI